MLRLLSLASFAAAALVEMGWPYANSRPDNEFTFNWVKEGTPIKTIEWVSLLFHIKYLKVTWADGSTEELGNPN